MIGHYNAVRHVEVKTDVLKGAASIAEFLFGQPARRREVYYLVEHMRLPVFRLGTRICARRSTLLEWIASQEQVCIGEIQ